MGIPTGTPILRDADLIQIIKDNGGTCTAALIMQATGMSISNANYRMRQLRAKFLIDQTGALIDAANVAQVINQTHPAQAPKTPSAPQAPAVHAQLVNPLDFGHLIPATMPDYITRRDVDERISSRLARGESVLLIGDASSGKTTAAEQRAAKRQVPFLRLACDDSAVLKDYIGRRELINGETIFKAGLLLQLFRVPCVILIDEFNALPPAKLFWLHELLDHRRFFLRDAGHGEVIDLHPECEIILACNPAGARYSGTNKMNAALIDRVSVINVPSWTPEQVPALFDTGNPETTEKLKRYYTDARDVIQRQSLRAVFTLRAVKRVVAALKAGETPGSALAHGFYNAALLTAGPEERDALEQLARVIFGISDRDQQAVNDFGKAA